MNLITKKLVFQLKKRGGGEGKKKKKKKQEEEEENETLKDFAFRTEK